jgi:hypothetical protein
MDEHSPNEGGIISKIAVPKPFGILQQSVDPLQAGSLDPWRTVTDSAGVIIECGTNSDQ